MTLMVYINDINDKKIYFVEFTLNYFRRNDYI